MEFNYCKPFQHASKSKKFFAFNCIAATAIVKFWTSKCFQNCEGQKSFYEVNENEMNESQIVWLYLQLHQKSAL